jgi:transketolase
MEGVSQEAIGIAGKQKLSRLIVLWDDNGITIDGKVEIADITDQKARFAASGWNVLSCDGHDPADIDRALTAAKKSDRPTMIACKTHIALGHAAQDTSKGHGALTDAGQMAAAKAAYGWTAAPFEVPAKIKAEWEGFGARGAAAHAEWAKRFAALSPAKQAEFTRIFALEAPAKLASAIRAVKRAASADAPKLATRSASEKVLAAVNPIVSECFGGSADLTGSNNTKTADLGVFTPENRAGRYMYWGIREHGMASAMNGMALHGGVIPFGGTFLVFSDYARPAIRLSALQQARVYRRRLVQSGIVLVGIDWPTDGTVSGGTDAPMKSWEAERQAADLAEEVKSLAKVGVRSSTIVQTCLPCDHAHTMGKN